MRKRLGLVTVLLVGWMALNPADSPGGKPMSTILIPSPDSPLVDFRIEFRVGSIHERGGQEGLNCLTASTVAGGGTESLGYQEVLEAFYPMATDVSVQAGKEVTVFVATVHRDHLEAFWDLFSALLVTPRFDEADFNRMKDIQLNYLRNVLRSTDDEELGKEALESFIFEGHPYGHSVYGTVRAVESLTLDDVRAFYRTEYTRDRVTIGLAGGYPEDFPKRVREALARLPGGRAKPVIYPRPKSIHGIEVRLVEKPGTATAVSLGFPIGCRRSSRDFFALFLANSYLGEHRTFKGRLMRHLRGDRGLNYGDYSYVEYFDEEPGTVYPLTNIPRNQQYFSIWLRPVAHRHAVFSLRAALRELRRLADVGLTDEEFESTRDFLLGYTKLWGQSMSRRLGYALDSDFYSIDRDYLGAMDRALRELTLEDVNNAVWHYLQAANVKVVMVTEDAEALKQALVSNAPSPITYEVEKPREILEEDEEIATYYLDVRDEDVRIIPATEMFEM